MTSPRSQQDPLVSGVVEVAVGFGNDMGDFGTVRVDNGQSLVTRAAVNNDPFARHRLRCDAGESMLQVGCGIPGGGDDGDHGTRAS